MLLNRDTVLVNRGWVPLQLADPKARVGGQVTGTQKILGLLRSTEKVSYFYCFHNICKIYDFHKMVLYAIVLCHDKACKPLNSHQQ